MMMHYTYGANTLKKLLRVNKMDIKKLLVKLNKSESLLCDVGAKYNHFFDKETLKKWQESSDYRKQVEVALREEYNNDISN